MEQTLYNLNDNFGLMPFTEHNSLGEYSTGVGRGPGTAGRDWTNLSRGLYLPIASFGAPFVQQEK